MEINLIIFVVRTETISLFFLAFDVPDRRVILWPQGGISWTQKW